MQTASNPTNHDQAASHAGIAGSSVAANAVGGLEAHRPTKPAIQQQAAGNMASPNVTESGIPFSAMVRALGVGVLALIATGWPVSYLVFGAGSDLSASLPYFITGIAAAIATAIISVWLSGRISANRTAAAGGDAALNARLEGLRLQGLMAAGFGAKLIMLVIGVFALRSFPLRLGELASDVKFVDLVSFAVTFAGAALVMQMITAVSIANTLRRRAETK